MSGGALEVEVKFLVDDVAAMRQRLLAAGAVLAKPRVHEHNVRLDDDEGTLMGKRQLLRLRQDDGARLTFKGVAAQESTEVKVREELEIAIGDFETALAIFERLGFKPRQVYEKLRETFRLGEVEVVLDELPIGAFMELEGSEEGIRTAAAQLGLPWSERILDNYLLLMARVKAFYDLPFDDLTFEKFAGIDVRMRDVLQRL